MKRKKILFLLLGIIAISLTPLACSVIKLRDGIQNEKIINSNYCERINFELIDNNIFIHTQYYNQQTQRFDSILTKMDDGSYAATLEPPIASQYASFYMTMPSLFGLLAAHSADGRVVADSIYKIPELRIGNLRYTNMLARSLNIAPHDLCDTNWQYPIAMIGKEVLRKSIWNINFDYHQISITDSIANIPQLKTYRQTSLPIHKGSSSFRVNIGSEATPLISKMDLGYSGDLFIDTKTYTNIIAKQSYKQEKWYGYMLQTFDSLPAIDTLTYLIDIPLQIEGFPLSHTNLVFSKKINRTLLGTGLMKNFNMVLDYLGHHIYLNPNNNYNQGSHLYEHAAYLKGIHFDRIQHKIIIGRIQKNGLAEMAGLQFKDVIIGYNEEDIDDRNQEKICLHLNNLEKLSMNSTPLTLKILRNSSILKITF